MTKSESGAPAVPKTLATFCSEHGIADLTPFITSPDALTVRAVLNAVGEKLSRCADILENMLYPSTLAASTEAGVLSETYLEEAGELYRAVMVALKDCEKAELEATAEQELALLRALCLQHPLLVRRVSALVERTKDAYQAPARAGPRASYLG